MAIKLSTHKCTDCSGLLEFNKSTKQFECPYCGKIYEKDYQFEKIQIDGMAGTNDVVRAVLLDIATENYDSAKDNLAECEKINFNYVGTIIANMCYYLFYSSVSKNDSKVYTAKTKYYLDQMNEKYPNVEEDETALYDFFSQPEIYAVIYATYQAVGLKERASYIANFLEFDKILNINLNKVLLNICIKAQAYNEAMSIIKNHDFIDKKYSLYQVLKYFPDNEDKVRCINLLFNAKALTYKDSQIIEKYLDETKDGPTTKLEVLIHAITLKINVCLADVLDNILNYSFNDDIIERTFESIKNIRLSTEDTNSIVDYITGPKCKTSKIAICALDSLKANGSLYEIKGESIIRFYKESLLEPGEKNEVFSFILETYRINQKSMDLLSDFMLNKYEENVENRYNTVKILFEKIDSITLNALNSYFLSSNKDGQHKSEIAEMICKLKINSVYFNGLLSNYINKTNDDINTIFNMINLLSSKGCDIASDAAKKIIINYKMSENQIDYLFNKKIQISDDTLNLYLLKNIRNKTVDNLLISKLLKYHCVIDSDTISNYIIYSEPNNLKGEFTIQFIKCCKNIKFNSNHTCTYLDNKIECSFIHYYFFTTKDHDSTRLLILKELMDKKIKLSDDLVVNGKKKSFKKFITENKNKLEPNVLDLCESLGVFKLFF